MLTTTQRALQATPSSVLPLPSPATEYPVFGTVVRTSHYLVRPLYFHAARHYLTMVPGAATWEQAWRQMSQLHPGWVQPIMLVDLPRPSRSIPAGRHLFTFQHIDSQLPGACPRSIQAGYAEARFALSSHPFVWLEPLWHTANGQQQLATPASFAREVKRQHLQLQRHRKYWGALLRFKRNAEQRVKQYRLDRQMRSQTRRFERAFQHGLKQWEGRGFTREEIAAAVAQQMQAQEQSNFWRAPRLEHFLFDPIIAFGMDPNLGIEREAELRLVAHWD